MTRSILSVLIAVLLAGCSASDLQRHLTTPKEFRQLSVTDLTTMINASPFLKAHMRDGSVYIFSQWTSNDTDRYVTGPSVHLGVLRDTISRGRVKIGLDSVAIFESNVVTGSSAMTGFTLLTTVSTAATFFCLANPKACFGSCPTFYVADGDTLRLAAEGFSSSIAPALEATDVDALGVRPGGAPFTLRMTNEALETHVVRWVNLLAVPTAPGERVYRDGTGRFWASPRRSGALRADGPEGDCAPLLRAGDARERWSLADSADLGAKETIELEFPTTPGRDYGLVLGSRQALLPTYLLYQALAYMGTDAGRWLAEIERGAVGARESAIESLVGGIDLSVQAGDGTWQSAGSVTEHGPLARDTHLRPVGRAAGTSMRVRLTMSKGCWRIDLAELAELSGERAATRLLPVSVDTAGGRDDAALGALLDPARTLVTLPGDVYDITFDPAGSAPSYEYFLESRGYYLEWIRDRWIAEEDPRRLLQVIVDPAAALRRMAPEYKRVEATMEECFWGSRYAKP